MSPGATDRDATTKLPAVDARVTDPDATRKLPAVDAEIMDAEVADLVDSEVHADGDEVLTGEIVLRDGPASGPGSGSGSAELEPVPGTEGWLVDEALFPARPPISSHRRAPGVTVPLILAAVVVLVGAVAWVAVGHLGHNVPPVTLGSPRAVDVGVPPAGSPSSGATSGGGPQNTAPPVGTGRGPRPTTAPAAPVPSSSGAQSAPASTPPSASPSQTRDPLSTTPALVPVTTPTDGMLVRVVSAVSGQAMSVAAGATNDGAPIVQSTAATPLEQWKLVALMPGCFYLINQFTGKALDEPGGSGADGTQMQQWSYGPGNVNQMWCLRSVGNGQFTIQNIRTRMLLDLRDGGANGGVIQQWSGSSRSPGQTQVWDLFLVS